MRKIFDLALKNVTKYGDTDIFPFPIENHIFHDDPKTSFDLIQEMHRDFDKYLAAHPPANEGALAAVNYTGFRWATQIDPLWNLYILTIVLSISEKIELARLPKENGVVYSYRFDPNDETGELFDREYNWRSFMERSMERAKSCDRVVICDISEFYQRLGHHRLENALRQLDLKGDESKRIMGFLSNFSDTKSFGIPVGGPAARILSELVLNQIDRLLLSRGIKFCRFADDYHIFADSLENAYSSLVYLSEILLLNQGLQLQKSKTRIMTGAEFVATCPLKIQEGEAEARDERSAQQRAQKLLNFSIRFDPYSATAEEDYENIKKSLDNFDVIGLLKDELSKSRIHISLSRKIIGAVKFLEQKQKDAAILSLIENHDLLYPIFSSVMLVSKDAFPNLSDDVKNKVLGKIRCLIENKSHVFGVDLHLSYAIRLLGAKYAPESEDLLIRLYQERTSPLVRRDIILVLAKWGAWYWLSDLRARFRTLTPAERRSFIIASYQLKDEGKHWREHTSDEFSPFERAVQKWAASKANINGWSIPI